jgi:hypothetical protein
MASVIDIVQENSGMVMPEETRFLANIQEGVDVVSSDDGSSAGSVDVEVPEVAVSKDKAVGVWKHRVVLMALVAVLGLGGVTTGVVLRNRASAVKSGRGLVNGTETGDLAINKDVSQQRQPLVEEAPITTSAIDGSEFYPAVTESLDAGSTTPQKLPEKEGPVSDSPAQTKGWRKHLTKKNALCAAGAAAVGVGGCLLYFGAATDNLPFNAITHTCDWEDPRLPECSTSPISEESVAAEQHTNRWVGSLTNWGLAATGLTGLASWGTGLLSKTAERPVRELSQTRIAKRNRRKRTNKKNKTGPTKVRESSASLPQTSEENPNLDESEWETAELEDQELVDRWQKAQTGVSLSVTREQDQGPLAKTKKGKSNRYRERYAETRNPSGAIVRVPLPSIKQGSNDGNGWTTVGKNGRAERVAPLSQTKTAQQNRKKRANRAANRAANWREFELELADAQHDKAGRFPGGVDLSDTNNGRNGVNKLNAHAFVSSNRSTSETGSNEPSDTDESLKGDEELLSEESDNYRYTETRAPSGAIVRDRLPRITQESNDDDGWTTVGKNGRAKKIAPLSVQKHPSTSGSKGDRPEELRRPRSQLNPDATPFVPGTPWHQ